MNIRKFATITILVLSSFAATNVAPTKAELEAMYDKAFRDFNANNFQQALKELDAIDARQPDLAESHNLRGVILMRQADYDRAETALQKALATDPKFWNARFNLAQIPFLRKDWGEARKRFDALLQGNAAELQGEAAQLIQYKILLTYLLQGNENMVDSILTKFELSPETPAANYSRAAMAFERKNEKEAKELLATAEKNFSPQLNKLFAESLYEVGWMQKPAGQSRVALELTSAADQAAKGKALAAEKYEQAELAFQQLDLAAAHRLVDEADVLDPNQSETINLRGEILLAEKDFDGAEKAFKQALKLDPKLSDAHYNLAQIPFKKKEYAKARDRFEALFGAVPASGGDKNQTSQIIKFKIYLTLLLEGKDSRAQKVMEQFQFTGDTPALYYAQAAWEFKHDNTAKANLWIVSARKIYSPALNHLFADSFYDLGWLQRQSPVPAAASTEVAKTDAPPVEPSPIPATALASTDAAKQPIEVAAAAMSPATVVATETANTNAAPSPSISDTLAATSEKAAAAPDASPKVEMPVAANALPTETRAPLPRESEQKPVVVAPKPAEVEKPAIAPAKPAEVVQQSQAKKAAEPVAKKPPVSVAAASSGSTPATVLAPAKVREWSQLNLSERMVSLANTKKLFLGVLLSAGALLLVWVVYSELRRRVTGSIYQAPATAMGPRFDGAGHETTVEKSATVARLAGGPPQVSLQLRASEPSVRRAAVPFGKMNRPLGATGASGPGVAAGNYGESLVPRETTQVQPEPFDAPVTDWVAERAVAADSPPVSDVSTIASAPEWEFAPVRKEIAPSHGEAVTIPQEAPALAETPPVIEALAAFEPPAVETPVTFEQPAPIEADSESAAVETPVTFEEPAPIEADSESAAVETPVTFEEPPIEADSESAAVETPVTFEESAPIEADSESAAVETPVTFEEPAPIEVDSESVTVETPVTSEEPAPIEVDSELATAETPVTFEEPAPIETDSESTIIEMPDALEASVPVEAVSELAAAEMEVLSEAATEPISITSEIIAESEVTLEAEISQAEIEPVAQGQPIPYQVPAFSTDSTMAEITEPEMESIPADLPQGEIVEVSSLRYSVESPSFAPQTISTEPPAQQPTIPAIMPLPTQPTTAPIRTAPMTGAAPQPASGMQTAVQLTFSFEIASLQLTPSFKMGALQLKPTSKIVTMRLAPSQQPQPAMNLQVTFEISSVQLAGNAIGMIRLTPSQQQRPGVISSPAFNIAGLQLLSGADSGAVQLTPSQQGQASVHVTGRFQIATVEFSPSFEIASIVLNSTSKNVSVQLPGAGPSAVEGAPVFEIVNVQLAGNGEIGMMALTAQGAGAAPRPA